MGTSFANVYKVSSEAKVTPTLKPIDKKATFDIVGNTKDDETIIANRLPIGEKDFCPICGAPLSVLYIADIDGVFHFKTIDNLKYKNTYIANYNSDRLLFYPSGKPNELVRVVCFF
jgi:hypothetical protein